MSPSRHRGEIHPGLLVAGVLAALGLAWWFAQSNATPPVRSNSSVPAAAAERAGAEAPVQSGAQAQAAAQGPEKPLYRWTDAAGVVHFTDVAPADRPYERVNVDPERNVVRSPAEP